LQHETKQINDQIVDELRRQNKDKDSKIHQYEEMVKKLQVQVRVLEESVDNMKKQQSRSPGPSPNKDLGSPLKFRQRSQETRRRQKQIESDISFADGMLRSSKRSRERQRYQENPESSSSFDKVGYGSFGENPYQAKFSKSENLDYHLLDLKEVKEQMYSKLEFLKHKIQQTKQQDSELILGYFEIPNQVPTKHIIQLEIEHLNKISALINHIANYIATNKEQKDMERQKERLAEIADCSPEISLDQIIQRVVDKVYNLEFHGQSKKEDLNLRGKLDSLLKENEQLRRNKVPKEYEGILIENQMLQKRIEEWEQHGNYFEILDQFEEENDVLLQKAEVLSDKLKHLATELDVQREQNEKLGRENQFLKGSQSRGNGTRSQDTSLVNSRGRQYPQQQSSEFAMQDQRRQYSPVKSPKGSPGRSRGKKDEDSGKLHRLINDYKRENERCSHKIQELKNKLQSTK